MSINEMSEEEIEEVLDRMVDEGKLETWEENGKKLYRLTELGKALSNSKRN